MVLLNTEITCKSEITFLGIYITENLRWQIHIRSPCHSLNKAYCIIKSLKDVLSINMQWNIYFAYFQS
jgi:hypothetical protein